ncbi:MAG TPA: metallophosphatase domain-containing protein [Thiolinea sp.]|nr:metallophosphatase domain-containing protein [Thiolinea sp.]
MKLTFISDTHSLHAQLPPLGSGDVLVHCGDFTGRGNLVDTMDFAGFIAAQDFTHKIVIAGNHDRCFEDERRLEAEACLHDHGIIYLNDSGVVLEGLKFWGSPIQPAFFDWAFNRERGADIRRHWALIPAGTEVLITHGPPWERLDRCTHGARVGCEELLTVVERIRPRIHAFGHIHEDYGVLEREGTVFVNACSLNEQYQVVNGPISLEIARALPVRLRPC